MRSYIIETDTPSKGYLYARVKTGRGQYEEGNEVVTKNRAELEDWLIQNGLLPVPEPEAYAAVDVPDGTTQAAKTIVQTAKAIGGGS